MKIRGLNVMIASDLAQIYGVTTKALNQAVKRNKERFPKDFVFQLNPEEKIELVTNCDHLSSLKYSSSLPYAFTEHGALMVANVLKSVPKGYLMIFRTLNMKNSKRFLENWDGQNIVNCLPLMTFLGAHSTKKSALRKIGRSRAESLHTTFELLPGLDTACDEFDFVGLSFICFRGTFVYPLLIRGNLTGI